MNYTIPRKRELRREMGMIYMALDAVTKFMAKWLDDNLKTLSSDYWDRYVVSSLYESQRKTLAENGAKSLFDLDQPTILSVFLQNKQLLTSKFGVDQQLFGDAHRIKDIRNKYFHKNSKPLAASRYKHDLGTMKLFLEGLGAPADVVADICDSCDNEGETPSVSSRENDTVIKIPVPRVDSAIAVGVNSDAKGTQRQKDIVRAVKVVRNSPLAVGAMPQTLFSESSLLSMWHRPDELYASIKNCLKLDFDEYKFGKCLLYRPEDRVPSELSLGTGWQWAIVLQIFEADKVRIAKEIAKFNRFDVECSVTGDYAVWKYASPQGNHERAAEISQIVFLALGSNAKSGLMQGDLYPVRRVANMQTCERWRRVWGDPPPCSHIHMFTTLVPHGMRVHFINRPRRRSLFISSVSRQVRISCRCRAA